MALSAPCGWVGLGKTCACFSTGVGGFPFPPWSDTCGWVGSGVGWSLVHVIVRQWFWLHPTSLSGRASYLILACAGNCPFFRLDQQLHCWHCCDVEVSSRSGNSYKYALRKHKRLVSVGVFKRYSNSTLAQTSDTNFAYDAVT